MSVFIVAEAEVNHNGGRDRALAIVDAARDARADAIRFHPGQIGVGASVREMGSRRAG